MKDETLAPTLWKTCRVLASDVRLNLLRLLLKDSGSETIENLAKSLKISPNVCGFYLKQLQARGLCHVARVSRYAYYSIQPDPLVKQSAILLPVLMKALPKFSNEQFIHMLTAYTHVRRIRIVECLIRKSPQNAENLSFNAGMSSPAFFRHIEKLRARNVVKRTEDGNWYLLPPSNPFTSILLDVIRLKVLPKK